MDQDETWHAGRPRPWPHCVRWGPRSPSQKGGGAPKFSAHVYCVKTAGWIKMVLGLEVGFSPGDFTLDGDPLPPPKRGRSPFPIFGPFLLWPNGWMHQDATWYGGRPWPRRHCVRWGPSSALPKKGAEPPPQFSAHVYCGQTAGWIKVALGMEVGLGPGHIVLDGDTAPLPKKGTEPPNFWPIYIAAKRLNGLRRHLVRK